MLPLFKHAVGVIPAGFRSSTQPTALTLPFRFVNGYTKYMVLLGHKISRFARPDSTLSHSMTTHWSIRNLPNNEVQKDQYATPNVTK